MAKKTKKRKYTKRPGVVYGRRKIKGKKKSKVIEAMTEETKLNRGELAKHVGSLITKDRNASYGDPHDQFRLATILKEAFRTSRYDNPSNFGTTEIEAVNQILTKVSRLACGQNLQDTWLDIAGYALIAAEKAQNPL